MSLGKHGDRVFLVVHLHVFAGSFTSFAPLNVDRNRLLDGELDSTLSDKSKISTREAVSVLCDEFDVNVIERQASCGAEPSGCPHAMADLVEERRPGCQDVQDGTEHCRAAQDDW